MSIYAHYVWLTGSFYMILIRSTCDVYLNRAEQYHVSTMAMTDDLAAARTLYEQLEAQLGTIRERQRQRIEEISATRIQFWWKKVRPQKPRAVVLLCLCRSVSPAQAQADRESYETLALRLEKAGCDVVVVEIPNGLVSRRNPLSIAAEREFTADAPRLKIVVLGGHGMVTEKESFVSFVRDRHLGAASRGEVVSWCETSLSNIEGDYMLFLDWCASGTQCPNDPCNFMPGCVYPRIAATERTLVGHSDWPPLPEAANRVYTFVCEWIDEATEPVRVPAEVINLEYPPSPAL